MASRRIHKITLQSEPGTYAINLPAGWKALHVAGQYNRATLWYSFNPDEHDATAEEEVLLCNVLTGEDIPSHMRHLGTSLLNQGSYVVHVFAPERSST